LKTVYWCKRDQCRIISEKPDKWGYSEADGNLHPCFENEKGPHSECRNLVRKPVNG